MFLSTPVFAYNFEGLDEVDIGAKLDAPNLIALGTSGNHHIGAEISITDLTEDFTDGSQFYAKYTYTGTLFSFFK